MIRLAHLAVFVVVLLGLVGFAPPSPAEELPTTPGWTQSVELTGKTLPLGEAVRRLAPTGVTFEVHDTLLPRKVSLVTAGQPRREVLERIAELFEAKWTLKDSRWRLVPDGPAAESLRNAGEADVRARRQDLRRTLENSVARLARPEERAAARQRVAEAMELSTLLQEQGVPPDDPRFQQISETLREAPPDADALRLLLNQPNTPRWPPTGPFVMNPSQNEWLTFSVIPSALRMIGQRVTLSADGTPKGSGIIRTLGSTSGEKVAKWHRKRGWLPVPEPLVDLAEHIDIQGWVNQPNRLRRAAQEHEAIDTAQRERRPLLIESLRITGAWFDPGTVQEYEPLPWWALQRGPWRLVRPDGVLDWRATEPSEAEVTSLASGNPSTVVETLAASRPEVRQRLTFNGLQVGTLPPVNLWPLHVLTTLTAPDRRAVVTMTPIQSTRWTAETWTYARTALMNDWLVHTSTPLNEWQRALLEGRAHPDLVLAAAFRRVVGSQRRLENVELFQEDIDPAGTDSGTPEARLMVTVFVGRDPQDCLQWSTWLPAPLTPTQPAPEPEGTPPPAHEGSGKDEPPIPPAARAASAR